jgi:acetyl-CoA C-acetyltransferase
MLRGVVTFEEIVNSLMIADPLHRLDCFVVTDGGGALVVTRPEIARSLKRPLIALRGSGEAIMGLDGYADLTRTTAVPSGWAAFP